MQYVINDILIMLELEAKFLVPHWGDSVDYIPPGKG